jgi:hypothetical protein
LLFVFAFLSVLLAFARPAFLPLALLLHNRRKHETGALQLRFCRLRAGKMGHTYHQHGQQ